MRDRVPKYPGRVRLTPVAGKADTFDMVRADEPVEEGTALSKATLLSDETAEFLGLVPTDDPTVDDAFVASVLSSKSACLVRLTVTVGGHPAKAGLPIEGLTDLSGGTLYTKADGTAVGLATTESTTLTTLDYLDMPKVSKTISTPLKTIVTAVLELSAPTAGTKGIVTTTTNILFSPYVTDIDIINVGGGGGGNAQNSGGGGGYVVRKMNVVPPYSTPLTAVVGSGGEGSSGSSGGRGGTSSFMDVSAAGGQGASGSRGGSGNGTGGYLTGSFPPALATDGTGGGGGGGGAGISTASYSSEYANAGSPCGGRGSLTDNWGSTQRAQSGSAPGGGGGGSIGNYPGAGGGSGRVTIVWRVAS